MKLVVGLGNPGRKYQQSRHNVGFEVLADLAGRLGLGPARSNFQGLVVLADLGGARTVLLRPQSFMNKSGSSVVKARDFYKLDTQDLLIVCDDFNLPLARLRFRAQGSSGGQKGLDDIIRCLGSEEFPRLRIGIGQPPAGLDPADYVLGRFARHERPEIEAAVWRAADAVKLWAREGIESCMNQYNSS